MTQEQLIEEILLEASGLGIRQEVLDASEKYLDQGMDQLDAIETAFSELTDNYDYDIDDDESVFWDDPEFDYSEDSDDLYNDEEEN